DVFPPTRDLRSQWIRRQRGGNKEEYEANGIDLFSHVIRLFEGEMSDNFVGVNPQKFAAK
ncbi:hypothetical protein L0156_18925, partial [bacterium]|nr:hypothetical protein [bacterium]